MTEHINTETLAELERLEKLAAPTPWECDSRGQKYFVYAGPNSIASHGTSLSLGGAMRREHAELVAAMRNALPALIAEIRRQSVELHNALSEMKARGEILDDIQKAASTTWWYGAIDVLADLRRENHQLLNLNQRQAREISDLNELADSVECLRDIGKVTGCDHVDDPDGRRKLVNCVEEVITKAETERDEARKILAHVPARIALKAKENAGFGVAVVPTENEP